MISNQFPADLIPAVAVDPVEDEDVDETASSSSSPAAPTTSSSQMLDLDGNSAFSDILADVGLVESLEQFVGELLPQDDSGQSRIGQDGQQRLGD